jgi:SPP1 gp7 family putative phage head morphogenesis protein
MATRPVRSLSGRPRLIAPIHPNLGIEIIAAYRARPPELAADASPANTLRAHIAQLGRRWLSRFDIAAPKLAKWFATAAADRSDKTLRRILRDAGISVKFQMSRAANDAIQATIGEQVGLIKSIAQQHLTQVEGMVMRSVQTGRDIGGLTKDLQETFGVSFRRAAFIAKDQNNKATATIQRVRQQGLGITQAVWLHSGGGNEPRPEHVKWSGKTYDVAKGMWSAVDQEWVWPGTAINCRCVTKSIVPGYDA